MFEFSKIKFDVKTVGAIILLVGMWYDLKTDFAIYKEKHSFLEYRISQLEGGKIAAILPKETHVETEKE